MSSLLELCTENLLPKHTTLYSCRQHTPVPARATRPRDGMVCLCCFRDNTDLQTTLSVHEFHTTSACMMAQLTSHNLLVCDLVRELGWLKLAHGKHKENV